MCFRKTFRLNGRNVIVTGASGGLGRAMTLLLIRKYGCRVLGVARNEQKLLSLQSELGELSDRFSYRILDVSQRESWKRLAELVTSGSFDADVLINNAGMLPRFAKFGLYSQDEIEKCLSLDQNSVITSAEQFVPLFEEKAGTAIINIASADALCPLAGTSLYSAAKSAVRAFSEALREEYRGKIYIPAVCPGFIRTDIMNGQGRSVSPLIRFFSMPSEKAAGILLRRVNAGRSRIVFGMDAHFMSAAYKIAPVRSLQFFKWVFRVSGLELFQDVF